MAPSVDVRMELERLNDECKEFCLDESNWTASWQGADSEENPNFLLAYSSVETFEHPGSVMILGTNPGGDHTRASVHPISVPFECPHWSSYLDDDWGNGESGEEKRQRAVRRLASVLAGDSGGGDELLRRIPTGNLIPFRSNRPECLYREDDSATVDPYACGLSVGWQLITIARPRVLILTASNELRWNWLMAKFNGRGKQEWSKKLPGSNRVFREAIIGGSRPRPEFIWALPRVNTGTAGPRPGEELRDRLQTYGVRVTKSGQVRVSKQ